MNRSLLLTSMVVLCISASGLLSCSPSTPSVQADESVYFQRYCKKVGVPESPTLVIVAYSLCPKCSAGTFQYLDSINTKTVKENVTMIWDSIPPLLHHFEKQNADKIFMDTARLHMRYNFTKGYITIITKAPMGRYSFRVVASIGELLATQSEEIFSN